MDDRDILAQVKAELGITGGREEYDEDERLIELNLSDLGITYIPVELGHLTNLQELWLHGNHLTQLPMELGHRTNLQELSPFDNPDLLTPPPEIVAQGTQETLAFLRELQRASITRYEAKLLLVGEGGTGKSSLLRALRGQDFEKNLDTTHGIAVENRPLPHPQLPAQALTLNAWDFGGQDIYHATHQFFLTERSVYVVVWNARTGSRDSKLDYWLDTIQVLAPKAPVLLVATHIDERTPDLNVQQYRSAYPQIVDVFAISSKTDEGLEALKQALALHAASRPLMGQPWPTAWVNFDFVPAGIMSWFIVRTHRYTRNLHYGTPVPRPIPGSGETALPPRASLPMADFLARDLFSLVKCLLASPQTVEERYAAGLLARASVQIYEIIQQNHGIEVRQLKKLADMQGKADKKECLMC